MNVASFSKNTEYLFLATDSTTSGEDAVIFGPMDVSPDGHISFSVHQEGYTLDYDVYLGPGSQQGVSWGMPLNRIAVLGGLKQAALPTLRREMDEANKKLWAVRALIKFLENQN